ncbi:MAG: hypothetical protein K8F30_07890, partial [Taibaiella sp.]|nr:hypothetical protein [Taibaiella sp.]
MRKGILGALCLLAAFSADASEWADICKTKPNPYCKAVGQSAYNATGPAALRRVRLGEIKGVTWRPKGSVIGASPAIPAAGIPKSIRVSPRDAFYFIVDDGSGKPFLR